MSTQHEALRIADQLKDRYGATVPTSQAAAMLRKQHALIVQMAETLTNMTTPQGTIEKYIKAGIDAKAALAEAKDYLK